MSSASEFIDEPPTWKDIIAETVVEHKTGIYAAGALFFSTFAVVGVSLLIHIHFFDIGWVSLVEARNEISFADEANNGVYLNVALYILADMACLSGLVSSWRE